MNPFLVATPGQRIPQKVKDKFFELVAHGDCITKREIADRCHVSYGWVIEQFRKNPELKKKWDECRSRLGDEIEECGVSMCRDESCHPIARQKMIEFMLPKLKPEVYGESADILSAAKNVAKRIIIAPVLKEVRVDANGIPIGANEDPEQIPVAKSEKVIDV